MAQRAKIVFINETCVIVDKTVAEAKTIIAAATTGGIVEFPTTVKKYNYALNTINIGEKTTPAYTTQNETKLINVDQVERIEAVDEDYAKAYTGV